MRLVIEGISAAVHVSVAHPARGSPLEVEVEVMTGATRSFTAEAFLMVNMVKNDSLALTITVNQQCRCEVLRQIDALILINDET